MASGLVVDTVTVFFTLTDWMTMASVKTRAGASIAAGQQPKLPDVGEALSNLSPAQIRQLEEAAIPGVRIHGSAVGGLIDAQAAAAKFLHLPAPPHLVVVNAQHSDLREYQSVGVNILLGAVRNVGGALLADDVGLGKTRQALTVAKALGGRTFIVAPAHCRSTWMDECGEVLGDEVIRCPLTPITNKKTKEDWSRHAAAADVVVTSYELAEKALTAAFPNDRPTTLIMDEAHYLCGRRTKRSTFMEELARVVPYRLAITGTPMYSRPRDLYKLLRVLFGNKFGSPSAFDFRYCAGFINAYGGMTNTGISNADELKLRLSYYCVRREKKDVLDELPPLTRQVLWVDGTEKARRAFHYALNEDRSERGVVDALVATLDEKLDVAVQLAVEAKRFVLFTYLKRHAAELHRRLITQDTPCVLITGDVSHDERDKLAKQAARQKMGVVATIDSAGTGINSLRDVSDRGIFHSIPWVPNQALQAEGRLHRMGQKGSVHWTYIAMSESMDSLVVKACINKLDAVRSLLPSTEGQRSLRDSFDDEEDTAAALRDLYEGMK